MPLILRQRKVGPITLLELGERLTIEHLPELRDCIQDLDAHGHLSVLLECSQVRKIDSEGIGVLVSSWVSLRNRGGKLKLLNPSARLQEVLQIVGLHKIIESFDDIEHALRNF